jgi:hypothetical protein
MQQDSELPASYDAIERAFAYTNEFQKYSLPRRIG